MRRSNKTDLHISNSLSRIQSIQSFIYSNDTTHGARERERSTQQQQLVIRECCQKSHDLSSVVNTRASEITLNERAKQTKRMKNAK